MKKDHRKGKRNMGRECYIENHVCKIPSANGQTAICDEDRFEEVSKHNWCTDKIGYPKAAVDRKFPNLHRFLYPELDVIDHINHNKLDNRACNLRLATRTENLYNSVAQKNNLSGFKGVKTSNKGHFEARIRHSGKTIYIGGFKDPIEAAKAYDEKAKELHGQFAYLNFGRNNE